ncbi:hypothetical protein FQN55_004466 [Onygenales sp. PD_40]|nr:hypothetical protein FQN55_004466 [Onygenales sp. PD_40]
MTKPRKSYKNLPDSQHEDESTRESYNADFDSLSPEEEAPEYHVKVVKRKNSQFATGHGKNTSKMRQSAELSKLLAEIAKQRG